MKILYFAWLRQKTGIDSEDVEMPPEISDVAGLLDWLRKRNSILPTLWPVSIRSAWP